MKLTLLDTKTGIIADHDSDFDAGWWAEGNGFCDCNRATVMDRTDDGNREDEIEAVLQKKYPELKNRGGSYCFGAKRFLIIKTDSTEYDIEAFNSRYPEELKARFLSNGTNQTPRRHS